MIDYTRSPLNEKQLALLSAMRARIYTNGEGRSFLDRRYFSGILPGLRDALDRALFALRDEGVQHE